jgi:hypothetical protein
MNQDIKTTGDFESIEIVKANSIRASQEGFAVLDALKDGSLSLSEASEYSNALGKINAANSNVLKADLLTITIDKQTTERMKRLETKHLEND